MGSVAGFGGPTKTITIHILRLLGLVAGLLGVAMLFATSAHAAIPARGTDDSWYAQVASDSGYNSAAGCNLDQYGYCLRNCTSFVAQKLAAAGVNPATFRGLGNAVDWQANAAARGVAIGSVPRIGSVAYSPGTSSSRLGHVAFVSGVNANGSVNVQSYNGLTEQPQFEYNTFRFSSFVYFSNAGATLGSASTGGGYGEYRGSTLGSGQTLARGQYIASDNVQFVLTLQGDGNLVLYRGGRASWSSRTAGSGANRLVMQGDGNLVLYAGNIPRWYTRTAGTGANRAVMQSDGNFVVYAGYAARWNSGTWGSPNYTYLGSDRLLESQTLPRNYYLRSTDRRYAVLLQPDGNLVLYSAGYRLLWNSGAGGADRLIMQNDGNLVLYAGSSHRWYSGTDLTSGSVVVVQNDGNFVLYGSTGALWSTNTGGRI